MHRKWWFWALVALLALLLGSIGALGMRLWDMTYLSQPAASEPDTILAANQPAQKLQPETSTGDGSIPAADAALGWDSAPACANQPLDVQGWAQQAPQARSVLAAGSGLPEDVLAAPAALAPAQSGEQPGAYAALKLDIASGRINRATGIQIDGQPEIQTVGDLIERIESSGSLDRATGLLAASSGFDYETALQAVLAGTAITRPVCAQVMLLAEGRPAGAAQWASETGPNGPQAVMSGASGAAVSLAAANPPQAALDWGAASPDGAWAVYTSLGMDQGGPVFVQDLRSGAWTNLIDRMNAARGADQPELNPTDWWTVVGWFPDSQRLMLARSDVSSAVVVDRVSGAWQAYAFPGGGNGGSPVLDLAADGSRFVYLGLDESGNQTINLVSLDTGETTEVFSQPLAQGVRAFPRFSPDGTALAYLYLQGDPQNGMTYSIELLDLGSRAVRTLVPGNVGFTVPAWSPDGAHLAFVRPSSDASLQLAEGQAPAEDSANVWVANLEDGSLTQVTGLAGAVRSPQWANDGRTLAFITQDGQVGLANLDVPGRLWAASTDRADFPLLSAVFFVP